MPVSLNDVSRECFHLTKNAGSLFFRILGEPIGEGTRESLNVKGECYG